MNMQTSENKALTLGIGRKIIFALGQFGWSLAAFSSANVLTYFYLPPQTDGQSAFPVYIFQGAVLGIATIIGLINFGGRFFDAITDPIIANMSDRSRSRFGKRMSFMGLSALPFALFSWLMFVPLVPYESSINSLWLIFSILIFYLALTMYCTPYNALISELGHTPNERLDISTYISVTWALGFAVGNQVYLFQGIFEKTWSMAPTQAFQAVVGMFAVIAFVLMMLPVLFISEKKYANSSATDEGVWESLRSAFANRNFLFFTLSDFMYWLSLSFIQIGISYYIIVLLGLEKEMISGLMIIMFALSFVFYLPVNLVARKIGKKKVLIFGFVVFGLTFVLVSLLNYLPFSATGQAYLLIILAAVPMSVFGILPNAIIADVADADGIETQKHKAGIFFGARTFMMKMGISVANLIFPSLLLLGRSTDNDLGIRLTAIMALIFCLAGLVLFLKYDENKVLTTLSKRKAML